MSYVTPARKRIQRNKILEKLYPFITHIGTEQEKLVRLDSPENGKYLHELNDDMYSHIMRIRNYDNETNGSYYNDGDILFIPYDQKTISDDIFKIDSIDTLDIDDKIKTDVKNMMESFQDELKIDESKLTNMLGYHKRQKRFYIDDKKDSRSNSQILKRWYSAIEQYVNSDDPKIKESVKTLMMKEHYDYLKKQGKYNSDVDDSCTDVWAPRFLEHVFKVRKEIEPKYNRTCVDLLQPVLSEFNYKDGKYDSQLILGSNRDKFYLSYRYCQSLMMLYHIIVGPFVETKYGLRDYHWNLYLNSAIVQCFAKQNSDFPIRFMMNPEKSKSRYQFYGEDENKTYTYIGCIILPFIDDRGKRKHPLEKLEYFIFNVKDETDSNDKGKTIMLNYRGNRVMTGIYFESPRLDTVELQQITHLGMKGYQHRKYSNIFFFSMKNYSTLSKERPEIIKDLVPYDFIFDPLTKTEICLPYYRINNEIYSLKDLIWIEDVTKYNDEKKNDMNIFFRKVRFNGMSIEDDGWIKDMVKERTDWKEGDSIIPFYGYNDDGSYNESQIHFSLNSVFPEYYEITTKSKHSMKGGGLQSIYTETFRNMYIDTISTDKLTLKWNTKFSKTQEFLNRDLYQTSPYSDYLRRVKSIQKRVGTKKYVELRNLCFYYDMLAPKTLPTELSKQIDYKKIYSKNNVPIKYWFNERIDTSILYYEYITGLKAINYIGLIKVFDILKGVPKVLSFNKNYAFTESVVYQYLSKKYKIKLDKYVTNYHLKYYFFKDQYDEKRTKSFVNDELYVGNFNNIVVDKPLYNLKVDGTYDLVHLDASIYDKSLGSEIREYYNNQLLISMVIIMLQRLKKGGDAIVVFWDLKTTVTIHLLYILTTLFTDTHLFVNETTIAPYAYRVVFKNYKGVSKNIIKMLLKLNDKLYELHPTGGMNYNVNDPKERKKYNITKSIDPNISKLYLSDIISSDKIPDSFYNQIREFVGAKINVAIKLLDRMEHYINSPDKEELKKEYYRYQLYHAVTYAQAFDLRLKESFNSKAFHDEFGKSLIRETYSLDNTVSFSFKKYKCKDICINIKCEELPEHFEKDAIRYFMAGRAIDYRPIEKYLEVIELTRNYKKTFTGRSHKMSIYKEVSQVSGAKHVSQAWLKMYEMMYNFKLFNKKKKKIKTFHLCEAPGSFILAINHYLKTKTDVDIFDWNAQSLNPKSKKILLKGSRDVFGTKDPTRLLREYPDRWIWGKDGTGDITNPENILSYKKYCEDIDFMTIDCGVGRKQDIIPINYAQIVFLLTNLPTGKNFVMKMLMPFLPTVKISLFYLLYGSFEEIHFYRSLQNPVSEEFYVIGINYEKPLSKKDKVKMLKYMRKFDPNKSLIPCKDIPDSFIKQLELASQKLTDGYVHEMERRVYYIDNLEQIDDTHREFLKKSIDERNKDWIKHFKIKRIKESDKLV